MNGARVAQPRRSRPPLRRSLGVSQSANRPRVSVTVWGDPALDPESEGVMFLPAKRSAEPEAEVRGIVTRKGRYTCVPGSEASRARPGGRTHGF